MLPWRRQRGSGQPRASFCEWGAYGVWGLPPPFTTSCTSSQSTVTFVPSSSPRGVYRVLQTLGLLKLCKAVSHILRSQSRARKPVSEENTLFSLLLYSSQIKKSDYISISLTAIMLILELDSVHKELWQWMLISIMQGFLACFQPPHIL